jgi:hypothetical protein
MIRAAASCANEAVDTLALPAHRRTPALERVAQRYAKVLGVTARDLQGALRADGADVRVDWYRPPPADASGIPTLEDTP